MGVSAPRCYGDVPAGINQVRRKEVQGAAAFTLFPGIKEPGPACNGGLIGVADRSVDAASFAGHEFQEVVLFIDLGKMPESIHELGGSGLMKVPVVFRGGISHGADHASVHRVEGKPCRP